MNEPTDNRAVSALFRVFGDDEPRPQADGWERPVSQGLHRGEFTAFSILVPLTLLVMVAGITVDCFGKIAGGIIAAPLAFLTAHLLPFVLGGLTVRLQWRLWLSALLIWAIWKHDAPGITGLFSHAWMGIGVMNLAALAVLAWQASMRWSGVGGMAWRALVFVALHGVAIGIGIQIGWGWGLLTGAVIAGVVCHAILNPSSAFLGEVVTRTGTKEILVTIDDGPDPVDTPVLLDLLEKHGAKAVFFMIGEKVRAHPELVREVIRRGHEIGNHTLTHPQATFWCAGPWRTWREISGCQKVISEITGVAPRWFRAPVGHRNLFTHPVARMLGLRVMAWNRRGYDAVEKDAAKVLHKILPGLGEGDIVLIHESTPIAKEVAEGVLAKSHPVAGE